MVERAPALVIGHLREEAQGHGGVQQEEDACAYVCGGGGDAWFLWGGHVTVDRGCVWCIVSLVMDTNHRGGVYL